MPRLNIRKFKRDTSYANGTVAFTTPVSFPSAIVGGINIGDALASGHGHDDTGFVYVDSKQTGNYTEIGTETAPYRSLTAACAAKLTNASTSYIVFKLLPGNYDGAISIDNDSPNQSFEIVGSGKTNTFIRGGATFSEGRNDNVLYFRDFLDITIRSLSIRNGKYGFYPRDCRNVKVIDCDFKWLGSDGTLIYHDQSQTKSSQAAFWAGNQTSNGGTCRIRSVTDHVLIDGCRSSYCARGFRVQDCQRGVITNTHGYKLLESFVYLASGSYDGQANNGCTNFVVSGCSCDWIFHSGYLCVGGSSNSFVNCTARHCASSPFNTWHANDVRIIGCSAHKCLTLTYQGIGVDADAFGQIYKAGATNVSNTDGYELIALNNTFTECGIGRSLSGDSTTFYFLDNASNTSSRFIIDGNNSDATVGLFNPDSITEVSSQYPTPGVTQADFTGLEATVTQNVTNIANLTPFSGDPNLAVVTDGNGDLAALATVTKTELEYLQNVDADLQASLADRLKKGSEQIFTGTKLKMESNGNQEFSMVHTGYGARLKLHSSYGAAGINYNNSTISFYGNSVEIQSVLFRIPRQNSTPTETNNASFGCIYCDTSAGAGNYTLRFHTGTEWKTCTLT